MACANKTEVTKKENHKIDLGWVYEIKIASNELRRKPKREIASICISGSIFDGYKKYETLTIHNLMLEARKHTNESTFYNVGIWHKNLYFLFWKKKCLILGDL